MPRCCGALQRTRTGLLCVFSGVGFPCFAAGWVWLGSGGTLVVRNKIGVSSHLQGGGGAARMHACAAVMRHHRSATKENNAACLLAYFPCLPEREGRAVCTQSSFLVKRRRPQPVLLRVGESRECWPCDARVCVYRVDGRLIRRQVFEHQSAAWPPRGTELWAVVSSRWWIAGLLVEILAANRIIFTRLLFSFSFFSSSSTTPKTSLRCFDVDQLTHICRCVSHAVEGQENSKCDF